MTDSVFSAMETRLDSITSKICDHAEKRSRLTPIQFTKYLAESDALYREIHGDSTQHARDSVKNMAELFGYKVSYIRTMIKVGRLNVEVLDGIEGSKLADRTKDLLMLASLPLQDQLSIVNRIQGGEDVRIWDRGKKVKDTQKYLEATKTSEEVFQQEAVESSRIQIEKEAQFNKDIERIVKGLEEFGCEAVRTLEEAGLYFASKGDVSSLKTSIDRLVKRVKALKGGQV